jgi:hypothetical protein
MVPEAGIPDVDNPAVPARFPDDEIVGRAKNTSRATMMIAAMIAMIILGVSTKPRAAGGTGEAVRVGGGKTGPGGRYGFAGGGGGGTGDAGFIKVRSAFRGTGWSREEPQVSQNDWPGSKGLPHSGQNGMSVIFS